MQTMVGFSAWSETYRQSPYAVNALEPECWEFEDSTNGSILHYRVRAATKEAAGRALDDLQPEGTHKIREDTLAPIEGNRAGSNETIWFGSRAVAVEADWCDS